MFPIILDDGYPTWLYVLLFGMIVGPILFLMISGCWDIIRDVWDGMFGTYDFSATSGKSYTYGTQGTKTTTYTVPKTKYKPRALDSFGLYPEERHEPPKALFFQRVNGVEVQTEGPWEEIHLKPTEKRSWDQQKRSKGILTTQYNTKIADSDESKAFLEQYGDSGGFRG